MKTGEQPAMFRCAIFNLFLVVCALWDVHATSLHLRSGSAKQVPPPVNQAAAAAVAPAAAPDQGIADAFAKMDLNKDGKVDVNEFVVAEKAKRGAAPAPAPLLAMAPAAVMAPPAPAPAPAAATDEVPEHLMIPPALPDNIPEPPPPPRAPPAEPLPPPLPPAEGQLVQAPPSEAQMEQIAKSSYIASPPAVDLKGKDPLSAPNTPPPLPSPVAPPPMPQFISSMAAPEPLKDSLMKPSPVAFGIAAARTLPDATPLKAVAMHAVPVINIDPYRVLLSMSSQRAKHATTGA